MTGWVLFVIAASLAWWFVRHSQREFNRGYRLAIDHLEHMTRPGLIGSYELPEAIEMLRRETRS